MTIMLLPTRFIEPCLPSTAERPPISPNWIHEIKHDGCRLMARRNAAGVCLLTRNGHNWANRFPLIVQAVGALRLRSCLIDGEAVCYDEDGLPVFHKLRQRRDDRHVFLYAFDLIELNGKDLRRQPIEERKSVLAKLLRGAKLGLQLNEHLAEPGDVVFRHACPARARRHRQQASRLALREWPISRLAQVQESQRAGSEAGSRGSVG
jgi:bifunctional non-homologous end joining protein LigD